MYFNVLCAFSWNKKVIDCRNARSGKLQDNRVPGGIYEPKKDEVEETEDNCMRSFLIRTPNKYY
jgi:hypothetical protein